MPIPILMPALSPTMEEGTLTKWLVKEGDAIAPGDLIAEIETDKATMEVEAVEEGILGRILVAEGTEGVKVNAPIALILEEGEDASAVQSAPAPAPAEAAPPAAPEAALAPEKPSAPALAPQPTSVPTSATPTSDGMIKASPLARRLAAQAGLDLASLQGSGPHGRIVKRDVEGAAQGTVGLAGAAATAQVIPFAPAARAPQDFGIKPGTYDEVPLDSMRKVVAQRMTESKQTVPHFPLTVDCQIDELLALRKQLNAKAPEGDGAYKISLNDFVIRASALALRKMPDVNASFAGDKRLIHHHADIAVAVAMEGGRARVLSKARKMGAGG